MKRAGVGAFSFLPPLTREEIVKQVEYILKQGWIPNVEYAREEELDDDYRSWWKLPLFNATTAEEIMTALDECRQAHPDCYIIVSGYNPARQLMCHEFVAYYPQS